MTATKFRPVEEQLAYLKKGVAVKLLRGGATRVEVLQAGGD
jgi:hypothetical protein